MIQSLYYRALQLFGRRRALPGRFRILRTLAPPDRMPDSPFETSFYGHSYEGNLRSFLDWNVYFLGAYSANELDLLGDLATAMRSARGRINYYDVGANVGHHMLFMSGRADVVIGFEPVASNLERLKRHMRRNGVGNAKIFGCALGEKDGQAAMEQDDPSNPGGARIVEGGDLRVTIRRGDTLLRDEQLPPIDILKVDVEGFEAAVLAGLRDTLLRDRPAILFELSGKDRSGFRTMPGLLTALYPSHRLYGVRWRRGSYGLAPFTLDAGEALCVPDELQFP